MPPDSQVPSNDADRPSSAARGRLGCERVLGGSARLTMGTAAPSCRRASSRRCFPILRRRAPSGYSDLPQSILDPVVAEAEGKTYDCRGTGSNFRLSTANRVGRLRGPRSGATGWVARPRDGRPRSRAPRATATPAPGAGSASELSVWIAGATGAEGRPTWSTAVRRRPALDTRQGAH